MGTVYPIYSNDATCITYTGNETYTNSSSYRINSVYRKDVHTEIKKPTKKEIQASRAKALHRASMVVQNEIQPNIFKVLKHLHKKEFKNIHRNYYK